MSESEQSLDLQDDGPSTRCGERESAPFPCVCGAKYHSRKAALRCCSDRWGDTPTLPDDLHYDFGSSCNVRETVRVPKWMRRVMDQLVRNGEFENRSEIQRNALKLYVEVYQRE